MENGCDKITAVQRRIEERKEKGRNPMDQKKKMAVFFPGIGYHTDKPLLYYSKKLAKKYGYTIVEAVYGELPDRVKGSGEKMRVAYECALKNVEEQLDSIDFTGYEAVLFVSKSLGTAVAATYAAKRRVLCKQVYYTPVNASFEAIQKEGIVFHGTADDWADTELIRKECEKRQMPLYLTEGANHSLETGDVQKDLKNLAEIMKDTEDYIEGNK